MANKWLNRFLIAGLLSTGIALWAAGAFAFLLIVAQLFDFWPF
jgi:hypothetical protein